MIYRSLILLFILLFSSGCYRMPEEGEVSVIPNTNNPNITKSSGTQMLMPPMLLQ